MHCLPLLIPLAGGALSFAVPEPNARNVPQHLRHKIGTKHIDCDSCEDDYHNGDRYNDDRYTDDRYNGDYHNDDYYNGDQYNDDQYYGDPYNDDDYYRDLYFNDQGQTAYAVLPASATRTPTSVTTTTQPTTPSDDSLDDPEVDFLPTIANGFYFDEYLDDFFGYYDFSDDSFPTALEDFAPGLSSYDGNDFDEDDLPQTITIGGQEYSLASRFCSQPPCDDGIRPRQLPALDPKKFATLEELLEEVAIRQETEREFSQWRASQSPPKQPPTRGELLSAPGIEMLQRKAARERVIARRESDKATKASQAGQTSAAAQASASASQLLSEASADESKARDAAAAAATGNAAKAVQIALDRKALPILPESSPVAQAAGKAEPLAIGKKVAEAAASIVSKDADKLKSIQDQAKSAAQKAQAAPKPTGLVPRAVNDDPTNSNSDRFNSILSSLMNSATQQPTSDEGDDLSTTSSAFDDSADPQPTWRPTWMPGSSGDRDNSTTMDNGDDFSTTSSAFDDSADPQPTWRPTWMPGSSGDRDNSTTMDNGDDFSTTSSALDDTSDPRPTKRPRWLPGSNGGVFLSGNNDTSSTPDNDDFNTIVSALVDSANQSPNASSSTPDLGYSAISDVTGSYFLAADNSGTLGLTAEPPSADAFTWKTFALFKGALAADARRRLFVYFPATMDALGVSRFRLARLNETSFDARAAAVVPVKVDGGDGVGAGAVLVPVDAEGASYAFVACNVLADGVTENKLFVVKDQDAGAKTLLDKATREEVTGGDVGECFPVALKSPLSAGL